MSKKTFYPNPLYELQWKEHQNNHLLRIERDAALSLFSLLDDSKDHWNVSVRRSKWMSFGAEDESEG